LQQGAEQGCAFVILDGSLFDWDRLDESTSSDGSVALRDRWTYRGRRAGESDRWGELGERRGDPQCGTDIDCELVVAAVQVLDEGVAKAGGPFSG